MKTNRITLWLLIQLLSSIPAYPGFAQTIISVQSGNWSETTVWLGGVVPGASDSVLVSDGHTITVDSNASCAAMIVNGGTQISAVTLTTGTSLTILGDVSVSSASTHVRKTIDAANGLLVIAGGLTLNGGNMGNEWAQLVVGSGIANVTGDLVLTNNRARLRFTGNGTLLLGGNLPGGGNVNAGTGTIVYDGSAPQTAGGYTYYNLSINNGTGTAIDGNVTVNGVLDLLAGRMALGSYNLTVGSSGSITGASSQNYLISDGTGKLFLTVNPDSITTFPIGTSTSYNPAGIQTGLGNETFSVGVADSLSPLPEDDSVFVQRMWEISEATPGGNGDATVQLQWNASDEGSSFTAASCISCRFDSNSWTPTGTVTDLTGSDPFVVTVTGIVEFGSFALSSGVVSTVHVSETPGQFSLSQNYPNPFNPTTVINYDIPLSGNVSLRLYDMLGREVTKLVEEEQMAGHHAYTLDGHGLATGVYYYRLTAGSFSDAKRLLLLK